MRLSEIIPNLDPTAIYSFEVRIEGSGGRAVGAAIDTANVIVADESGNQTASVVKASGVKIITFNMTGAALQAMAVNGKATLSIAVGNAVGFASNSIRIENIKINQYVANSSQQLAIRIGAGYKYGFNGMERDDEMKGSGNSYDFGARMYDSRLGRWSAIDPKFGLQPGSSPYKFAFNNPLIFIDPEGETEFYFKGKWIGTDGQNNNLLAIPQSGKLKREIKKSTRLGLNYSQQSTNKAAESANGLLMINRDVLDYSFGMLDLSLGQKGKVGEYSNTLKKHGNSYLPTAAMEYEEGSKGNVNLNGDVSIHSHPTGLDKSNGAYDRADNPSPDLPNDPGDESAFKEFETNIIVGKNGKVTRRADLGGIYDEGNRYPAINIYGSDYKKKLGTIRKEDAEGMLGGSRNRLGKKFDKKQNN